MHLPFSPHYFTEAKWPAAIIIEEYKQSKPSTMEEDKKAAHVKVRIRLAWWSLVGNCMGQFIQYPI